MFYKYDQVTRKYMGEVDKQIFNSSPIKPDNDTQIYDTINKNWVDAPVVDIPQYVLEQAIRSQRDMLLSECDWTQTADAPVDKEAWSQYRALLRNVPQQEGFPADVTWPEKPTFI